MHLRTSERGRSRISREIVLSLFFSVAAPITVCAQSVDVGGQVFLDYFYRFSSPVESQKGVHGFTYRRLNLTTDFALSEDFSGRARLEANDGALGPEGPIVFVKDLSLTWNYAGEHDATIGITSPPAFEVAERVWGYRSLEKTILDFTGIVRSRDFGIRFDGPIVSTGVVRYAFMLANNSVNFPETDPYKRAYALVYFHPTSSLHFTLGADRAGFDDTRESMTRVSAFGGYVSQLARMGIEGFYATTEMVDGSSPEHTGVSFYGALKVHPRWEAVVRLDRSIEELPAAESHGTFFLAGLSFQPNEFVNLIPNLWFFKIDDADRADLAGRFTVAVDF